MGRIEEIFALLEQCNAEERLQVFRTLRREFHIHPFEETLNTTAEVILEAISKSPDLTVRGFRGIIAEAAFVVDVVGPLIVAGWKDVTPAGDRPFDCAVADAAGVARVQVKMQRRKDGKPMMADQGYRWLPSDHFVTETQRTRGGKDAAGGDTRPYRFGEFDVLAVSLHPSTNKWSDFIYTVANWLIPDPKRPGCILKFQPVPAVPNSEWTVDFLEAVRWFRRGEKRRLCPGLEIPSNRRTTR